MCKNNTFNKILFFSFVFFFISFVSHIMISYAAEKPSEQKRLNRQATIQEDTSHIQIQQKQIIDHLEDMEKRYAE